MHRHITHCPTCGHDMIITELSCTQCDTVIQGRYTGNAFSHLSDENLRFVEIFVTCRGNVKEMERETGLGYWTIRGRLDEVIEALKPHLTPTRATGTGIDVHSQRRAILEAVERGEMAIGEAEQMLRALASPPTPPRPPEVD